MSIPPPPEPTTPTATGAMPPLNVPAGTLADPGPRVRLAVQIGGAVLMGVLFLMLGRRRPADAATADGQDAVDGQDPAGAE